MSRPLNSFTAKFTYGGYPPVAARVAAEASSPSNKTAVKPLQSTEAPPPVEQTPQFGPDESAGFLARQNIQFVRPPTQEATESTVDGSTVDTEGDSSAEVTEPAATETAPPKTQTVTLQPIRVPGLSEGQQRNIQTLTDAVNASPFSPETQTVLGLILLTQAERNGFSNLSNRNGAGSTGVLGLSNQALATLSLNQPPGEPHPGDDVPTAAQAVVAHLGPKVEAALAAGQDPFAAMAELGLTRSRRNYTNMLETHLANALNGEETLVTDASNKTATAPGGGADALRQLVNESQFLQDRSPDWDLVDTAALQRIDKVFQDGRQQYVGAHLCVPSVAKTLDQAPINSFRATDENKNSPLEAVVRMVNGDQGQRWASIQGDLPSQTVTAGGYTATVGLMTQAEFERRVALSPDDPEYIPSGAVVYQTKHFQPGEQLSYDIEARGNDLSILGPERRLHNFGPVNGLDVYGANGVVAVLVPVLPGSEDNLIALN